MQESGRKAGAEPGGMADSLAGPMGPGCGSCSRHQWKCTVFARQCQRRRRTVAGKAGDERQNSRWI